MLCGHRLSNDQAIELIGIAQDGCRAIVIDECVEITKSKRQMAIKLMKENRIPVHIQQLAIGGFNETIEALEVLKEK